LADRVGRLTPRELRVLLLLAEDLSAEDIAVTSGLSVQQVAGIRQALRRKLAVPPGQQLGMFVKHMPDVVTMARTSAAEPAVPVESSSRSLLVDRRSKLLLRKSIQELHELIERIESRVAALSALRDNAGDGDAVDHEIELLRSIGEELVAADQVILARARTQPHI
jgi:hypothetical protein